MSGGPATNLFVDYMGELGSRWGLSLQACRAHALMYLSGRPMSAAAVQEGLGLSAEVVDGALAYLADLGMAQDGPGGWRTGDDPWEMLVRGLAERRRREMGPALAKLREAHALAVEEGSAGRGVQRRIGLVMEMAEDLAALEAPVGRVSAAMLKNVVSLSGRTARLFSRLQGGRR